MKKETTPYFFFDLSFFLMHTPCRIFTEGEEEDEYIYEPVDLMYFLPISRSLASSLTSLYEKIYPGNIRPLVNFFV